MTGWATLQDVQDVTGQTVTAADLAAAQSVVETHVNRTPSANGGMRTRDLYWLKAAVCWQAAWMPFQPGYVGRSGVTGVSQDGISATYRSRADQLLAPLAQAAIGNLSWKGSRSIQVGRRRPRLADDEFLAMTDTSWLHSGADPEEAGWAPL